MLHGETQIRVSFTVIAISGLNSISFAHRVIIVIYTVLRGNRFAAQS